MTKTAWANFSEEALCLPEILSFFAEEALARHRPSLEGFLPSSEEVDSQLARLRALATATPPTREGVKNFFEKLRTSLEELAGWQASLSVSSDLRVGADELVYTLGWDDRLGSIRLCLMLNSDQTVGWINLQWEELDPPHPLLEGAHSKEKVGV